MHSSVDLYSINDENFTIYHSLEFGGAINAKNDKLKPILTIDAVCKINNKWHKWITIHKFQAYLNYMMCRKISQYEFLLQKLFPY